MAEEWDSANYNYEQEHRRNETQENCLKLGLDRAKLSHSSFGNGSYNSRPPGRGRGRGNINQPVDSHTGNFGRAGSSSDKQPYFKDRGRGYFKNRDCNRGAFKDSESNTNRCRGRGRGKTYPGSRNSEELGGFKVSERNNGTGNARDPNSNTRSRYTDNGNKTQHNWKEGTHNDSTDHGSRTKRVMGYHALNELLLKEADEVMFSLKAEGSGFCRLLDKQEIQPEWIAMILELLAIASKSNQPRNLSSLMEAVNNSKQFMFITLPCFISNMSINLKNLEINHFNSLAFLLEYLISFCNHHPATALKIVPNILPNVQNVIQKVFESDREDLNFKILEYLDELLMLQEKNVKKFEDKDLSSLVEVEKQHSQEPPNSFRSIPIYPVPEDLMAETPFLRSNIVEGKYIDVEHYLDVQFRLLREDSVRALREGIAEYRLSENGRNTKGLRIYIDVRILYPKCTVNGVAHAICFNMRRLQHVRWDTSKRLLEGSLVCLSKDNFDNMIFATITKRDCETLKDGIIFLRFENYDEVVKSIRPFESYIMVETSAFFEAYRHVLLALQGMHEGNFPFKRYIVEVCEKINPPSYLTEFTPYDLRPLLLDIPKVRVSDGGTDLSETVFPPLVDYVKKIPLLDQKAWPPADEMNLDDSQLDALRTALTKEIAIIQGPPGTGKTFVGLRIVQALLHNINIWRRGTNAPILIVCFTNHALDQFLEGVLYFTGSIVRVGGRSTSEILKPYVLMELRQEYKNQKAYPRELMFNKREASSRLFNIEKKINKLDIEITRACKDVLTEFDLKPHIMKEHLCSLRRGGDNMPEFRDLYNDQKLILDWLGVRFRGKIAQSWFRQQTSGKDFSQEQPEKLSETPSGPSHLDVDRDVEASWEYGEEDIADFQDLLDPEIMEASEESDKDDNPEYPTAPDQYWELNGGSKARQNYLTQMLNGKAVLKDSDAQKIRNIWRLSLSTRWQLYRLWVARYIVAQYDNINELQENYKKELNALGELRHACDLHIMKGAKVIGMTTTGAAKYKKLLQDLGPPILIVEEAAEVLEAHIVTSLTEKTNHLIMIGDHQQLRPIPSVYMLAKSYNLDVSLFERLVKNGLPKSQLSIQHRMRPCISKLLVPHIYKKLSDHVDTKKYLPIKGIVNNMFFITHDFYEGQEYDSTSKVNIHEAKFIVKLSKYILNQGYNRNRISILTTYSGQLQLIKKLMSTDKILEDIKATSVDNYQGEENDIILISFVRSNDNLGIGFLKTENRVCVALSRARMGLYCIGNFRFLAQKSDLWKNIVSELENQNAIGPDLHLYCQNHPETGCEVRKDSDFDSVPEGGCTRSCDSRLKCGHRCPRMCHAVDKEHKMFQCKERCNKITCKEFKHRCHKFCYQCHENQCGPCIFKVVKELPCGHEVKVACSISVREAECKGPCMKNLACGHVCDFMCGQPCNTKCSNKVDVIGPCGHPVRIPCYKSNNGIDILNVCTKPCAYELKCGHKCKGTCSECRQGRLHIKCRNQCNKVLVCGHICKEPCSRNCPPCNRQCENVCSHSRCKKICGIVCDPCRESCKWSCPHQRCSNLCGELCNRQICTIPCPKQLICKHDCVGLCGEPCPILCRICNKKKLTTIFFGTEDKKNARFVMLEDCQHVFEISSFFIWLEKEFESGVVKIPGCPLCKTPIRDSNHCLGNIIKKCLQNVSQVKEKFFGRLPETSRQQRELKLMARTLKDTVHTHFQPIVHMILGTLGLESLDETRLVAMENYLRMIQQMDSSFVEMGPAVVVDAGSKLTLAKLSIIIDKTKLEVMLDNLLSLILDFMMTTYKGPSAEQIENIDKEVQRFQLSAKLLGTAQNADDKEPLSSLDYQKLTACFNMLLEPKPFQQQAFKKVNDTIQALSMTRGLGISFGVCQLNISEELKRVIVSAIGLCQGHWFKCPKGHVYCIGECGGANEKSRCADCNATIGGVDHRLESENTLASEMDGATYAAYSTEANLANFHIDDENDWFDRAV